MAGNTTFKMNFQKPRKGILLFSREISVIFGKRQRQVHMDYRKDRLMKNAIVVASYIPDIEKVLKEKVPATAHEATERNTAILRDKPFKSNN